MDFNDYINQLGQLDKQEIEAQLSNFYTFNAGLLQFFKGIDNQFQALLNSSSLNAKSVEVIITQTTHLLPELNNLKFEITMLEEDKLSDSLKTEIHKTIKYIKEVMGLSEIELLRQKFISLLQENQKKFSEEIEANLQHKSLKEFIEREYGNGSEYKGEIINNLPNGKGKVFYNNELVIEGVFEEGFLNGLCKTFNNGVIYEEGIFVNGQLAKGKIFLDGQLFEEGEFQNGLLHGYGKMYIDNGKYIDEGFFVNGRLQK